MCSSSHMTELDFSTRSNFKVTKKSLCWAYDCTIVSMAKVTLITLLQISWMKIEFREWEPMLESQICK